MLELLADNDSSIYEKDTNDIRLAASFLARIRQACAEDVRLDTAELIRLFNALEDVGAKGWYLAIKEQDQLDSAQIEWQYERKIKEKRREQLKEENLSLRHERPFGFSDPWTMMNVRLE